MRIKRQSGILFGVLLLVTAAAFAGPLSLSQVGGDAKWVAHLDWEGMLNSQVGQQTLELIRQNQPRFDAKIQAFAAMFDFDPMTDLHAITLYGSRYGKHSGVAVIDATYNRDTLVALIRANTEYRKLEYGDHVIHKYVDEKEHGSDELPEGMEVSVNVVYASFYNDDTVVFGKSISQVEAALDVLDQKRESIVQTESIPQIPELEDGTFMMLAAKDFGDKAAGANPQASMLQNVRSMRIVSGESNNRIFFNATMDAKTEEDAAMIRQAIQGMIALMQMSMQEKPELRSLNEKIRVGGIEKDVLFRTSLPIDSAMELIKRGMEQQKRKTSTRPGV